MKNVDVEVIVAMGYSVLENGKKYQAGEKFVTSSKRARALRPAVAIVKVEEEPPAPARMATTIFTRNFGSDE